MDCGWHDPCSRYLGPGGPAGVSSPAVETAAAPAAFEAVSITPFTTNLGYNGEATIAPDNQTIAYVSDRTGRFDIFLRQIGTGADIALTQRPGRQHPARLLARRPPGRLCQLPCGRDGRFFTLASTTR